MVSTNGPDEDEPKSPPSVTATTSKRTAQVHVSPTYGADDELDEISPGGTVRDPLSGHPRGPRRRAKQRVAAGASSIISRNIFEALGDDSMEEYKQGDDERDVGEGEADEIDIVSLSPQLGSVKLSVVNVLDYCCQSVKPDRASPARPVAIDDAREPRERRFIGPAIAGTTKRMCAENSKIREALQRHLEQNLACVLEEFIAEDGEWLGEGNNMAECTETFLQFLDTLDCFPLIGFNEMFNPKDASDENIQIFFQNIARTSSWVPGGDGDTQLRTLSGDVIGTLFGDEEAEDGSIAANLADTSTWRHTYFSTEYIPVFFVRQFCEVGKTLELGDDQKEMAKTLESQLKKLENWQEMREIHTPEGDLRARHYDEPVNTYIWIVKDGEGAYVGETERRLSLRLANHRNMLISDGENAQSGHLRAREMLLDDVDFTASGDPTKCWAPVIDARVGFYSITHPTRRRMGRLLSALVDFVLEYRAKHRSNRPKHVQMPALVALAAFEGFFTEMTWTYFLKTWTELDSPWALNRSTPGRRAGGHRASQVVSFEDSARFAMTPWVLHCFDGDVDKARSALSTMRKIICDRYEVICGAAAGFVENVANKMLRLLIPNYWNFFVDLLVESKAGLSDSTPEPSPVERLLTARIFGGDTEACDMDGSAFRCLFVDMMRTNADAEHVRALFDSLGNDTFMYCFLGEAHRSRVRRASLKVWCRNMDNILPCGAIFRTHCTIKTQLPFISIRLVEHWIQNPQALRSLLELTSLAKGASPIHVCVDNKFGHNLTTKALEKAAPYISTRTSQTSQHMSRSKYMSTYMTWFLRFCRSVLPNKRVDVAHFNAKDFALQYSDNDDVARRQMSTRRLVCGVLLATADGKCYNDATAAEYKPITETLVPEPETRTGIAATINETDDLNLLQKAKELIESLAKKVYGNLVWSPLEEAVIVFVIATLEEKGGGAGALRIERKSVPITTRWPYWETVVDFVHTERSPQGVRARWTTMSHEEQALSYVDARRKLEKLVSEYEGQAAAVVDADVKATINETDDLNLLQKAKELIESLAKNIRKFVWSPLEEAVIVFVIATLEEKGGGAGALRIERKSVPITARWPYWETVLDYVHTERSPRGVYVRWTKMSGEEQALSYVDARRKLEKLVSEYEGVFACSP